MEDRVHHLLSELAGEGVLLARVVGAQQDRSPEIHFGEMTEAWFGAWARMPAHLPGAKSSLPTEVAESDHHLHAGKDAQLAHEVGEAVVSLHDRRLVGRRSALHYRRDVDV